MQLKQCEAIIFDSDGVLVDSEIIHMAVERELLSEMGLHYDDVTYLSRFVGLSNPDYYAELNADYRGQGGGEFPSDFGDILHQRTHKRMEADLRPVPGVPQLVAAFQGKVAVGSSAPLDRLNRKLEITGLASLFAPHIYSVDHVSTGKPAPDLFLHAASQIGTQPQKCAVIEDSVHGIKAACAADMLAIGFAGGGHADAGLKGRLIEAGAAFVASSHSEIENLL